MQRLIKITLIIILFVIACRYLVGREDSAYAEGYNQGAHDQDSINRMAEGWMQGGEISNRKDGAK